MKKLLVVAAFLCLFASSAIVLSQKRPPAQKKSSPAAPHALISVKATGTSRYTDKEILAASGLQLGKDAADADFQEAAQRLGQSGLFSDVVYTFTYSDQGAKVEFQLTDNPAIKLLPVNFENLVWFTDAELLPSLEQRVPLFQHSLLPASGHLPDEVNAALQALLSEKHLPGRVDYLRQSKERGGDLIGIEYRVEDVRIRIRNLEFPGTSPDQAAFLEKAARTLQYSEYLRSKLATVAQYDFLPLYLERGYLKAYFAASEARVVNASESAASATKDEASPAEIDVDAIVTVTPGNVYAVSGLTWKGNSAIKIEEAAALLHLAQGHPADAIRLGKDVESLTRLYHTRGYMTANITPEPHLDDAASAVQYTINIVEGELYRMGELEILGVDSASRDRLQAAWHLREGDPYNPDYVKTFEDEAPRFLPRGLQYSTNVNQQLDAKNKVVDVTIRFITH